MFENTRRSLTKYYVTMTVTLFTIMVICFLALLTWTLYNNAKLEAIAFANEEASEYIAFLNKNQLASHVFTDGVPDDSAVSIEEIHSALRIFSLIQLPDGKIYPITSMTKSIEGWAEQQIMKEMLSEPVLLSYKASDQSHYRIFFVRQEIVKDGKLIGTIYAGKDVTIIWSILKQMMIFSCIIIVCFIICLCYFGRKFAFKAMLPVEEAIQKQKQFISDASHELRTPLSVILTGTELVKTDIKQALSTENQKTLQDIQDEVRKMSSLVENLLNLSKIDEQGIDLFEETDVAKIAGLAIEKMRPVAAKKNINISMPSKEQIIWRTNNDVLAQILYILLDNAIKYTSEDGQVLVNLYIKKEKKQKLVLTVEDNGIGIPDNEQKHIFERFYRVDKARSRKESGSGLGLAILWSMLEKCGGKIELSSRPGKGSLFKVTLPEVNI